MKEIRRKFIPASLAAFWRPYALTHCFIPSSTHTISYYLHPSLRPSKLCSTLSLPLPQNRPVIAYRTSWFLLAPFKYPPSAIYTPTSCIGVKNLWPERCRAIGTSLTPRRPSQTYCSRLLVGLTLWLTIVEHHEANNVGRNAENCYALFRM